MAYNDLNNMLFPEDEKRKRDLEAVRATEAARQGQIDPGSQRLLERGGDIGFDPAADRARVEEMKAAFGTEGAAGYLRQEQFEREAREASELEQLVKRAGMRKTEAEARKTMAEAVTLEETLAAGGGASRADRLKELNTRLDIEGKIRGLPGKGLPRTKPEAIIRQAHGAEGVKAAPVEDYQAELQQIMGGLEAAAAAPAPPAEVRAPGTGQVTDPTLVAGTLTPGVRPPNALAASIVALKKAERQKKVMDSLAEQSAKTISLLNTAETTIVPLLDMTPEVFTGQPGAWNRFRDWARVRKQLWTQKGDQAVAVTQYKDSVKAAGTATARIYGEVGRISDQDINRYVPLLADIGHLTSAPDTAEVADIKAISMRQMLVKSRQMAMDGLALSFQEWLTMAQDNLDRNMIEAGLDPYKGKKPPKNAVFTSPKDVLDATRSR